MNNVIGRREFAKRAAEVEKEAIRERIDKAHERHAEETLRTKCCELLECDNPYEGCHVCFRAKGHRGDHHDPYTGHYWNETEVNHDPDATSTQVGDDRPGRRGHRPNDPF